MVYSHTLNTYSMCFNLYRNLAVASNRWESRATLSTHLITYVKYWLVLIKFNKLHNGSEILL